MEVPALRKDGVEFPIELSLSAWAAKGETFFTGIIRDVSERKEAERLLQQRTEETRQRTEELESLIQMVAHDLKSPIIAIAGLTRLLKKTLGGLAAISVTEKLLKQLEASSATAETFLKDLLDGLAAEAAVDERAPLHVETLIHEVTDQHKETLKERHIALEIEIPDSIPMVVGDLRRLKQVLENLIGNAIRYMGSTSEPRIRIQAGYGHDMVIISVSDNGIGVSAEFQQKIFERFFRAPSSGVSGGTGLGLPIVKKIVKHHGGAVWVESEEGMGSTFSFSLPIYVAGSEAMCPTRN
jgi:signal transduction histidine kinase